MKTEIVNIDDSIASAIASYNVTDASIAAMAEASAHLVTNGPEDKAALAAVKEARLRFRAVRVAVEKTRKKLKADALKYSQAVDGEARRIKALIEPHESRLQAEEDKVKAELKRRAEEAARLVREETERRVALLSELGSPFSLTLVEGMSPEEFETYLEAERAKARAAREEAARQKAEADRIAAEQAAEAQRIAEEKRKLQEAREEQARREAAAEAERRAAAAQAQAKLEAERAAFEAEKAEAKRAARIAAEEAQAKAHEEAAKAEAARVASLAPLERIAERLDALRSELGCDELGSLANELRAINKGA